MEGSYRLTHEELGRVIDALTHQWEERLNVAKEYGITDEVFLSHPFSPEFMQYMKQNQPHENMDNLPFIKQTSTEVIPFLEKAIMNNTSIDTLRLVESQMLNPEQFKQNYTEHKLYGDVIQENQLWVENNRQKHMDQVAKVVLTLAENPETRERYINHESPENALLVASVNIHPHVPYQHIVEAVKTNNIQTLFLPNNWEFEVKHADNLIELLNDKDVARTSIEYMNHHKSMWTAYTQTRGYNQQFETAMLYLADIAQANQYISNKGQTVPNYNDIDMLKASLNEVVEDIDKLTEPNQLYK